MPTREQLQNLAKQASAFQWTVIRAKDRRKLVFQGLRDLTRAITIGSVRKTDVCRKHAYAPPTRLATACEPHFALRVLLDPVGAYTERGAKIGGIVLLVLGIAGGLALGTALGGYRFLLIAALCAGFGVACLAMLGRVSRFIVLGAFCAFGALGTLVLPDGRASPLEAAGGLFLAMLLALAVLVGVRALGRVLGRSVGRMLASSMGPRKA